MAHASSHSNPLQLVSGPGGYFRLVETFTEKADGRTVVVAPLVKRQVSARIASVCNVVASAEAYHTH